MLQSDNDVWGTISKGIDAVKDVAIARQQAKVATAAAPSGLNWQAFNPFPGSWGAYPQAEGKPVPGVGFTQAGLPSKPLDGGSLMMILGAILVVVLLAFRR